MVLQNLQVRRNSTVPPNDAANVAQQLRVLMRSCVQPVTVASTRLKDADHSLHGATLSSFSSIALYPLPLVAFSIRQPSRLADALHFNRRANPGSAHGAINILAAHQTHLAVHFSRPDLYPKPFLSTNYRYEESLPVLEETVGTLLFSVLTSLPLSGEVLGKFGMEVDRVTRGGDFSSELFIARVARVLAPDSDSVDESRKPLAYYRNSYTSINVFEHKDD